MDTIIHKGKRYEVKPITIKMWSEIMKYKDIMDEETLYYKMISEMVGIPQEELLAGDAAEILKVGQKLKEIIFTESKQLFPKIEFGGDIYKLVDVHNMSFGQFVDIDSFLTKDENYRIANLNELAAYLYTKEGVKYGDTNFKEQMETFKELEIKYLEGAIFFLLNFGKGLQQLSHLYSNSKLLWWTMRLKITLGLIGDGIRQSISSRKTKFGRLMMSLLSPFYLVLIICRFTMTLIKKKKGK